MSLIFHPFINDQTGFVGFRREIDPFEFFREQLTDTIPNGYPGIDVDPVSVGELVIALLGTVLREIFVDIVSLH